MRSRSWAVALLLAGLAAAVPDAAAQCGMQVSGDSVMVNPCDEDGGWTGLDVGLGIAGLVLTLAGAAFATYKVRQRRATVGHFLRRVETTYAQARTDPPRGLPLLVAVRGEVRAHYTKGRLEDAPYLELEKRITSYIGRLRVAELDREVPALPATLRGHAERLLVDGLVSAADVDAIARYVVRSRVAKAKREGVLNLFAAWSREDEPMST
jgi:hypothetical protein